MKKILVFLCAIVIGSAFAETKNITWKVGDTTYATNTCEVGDDLIIPQTNPTKYGYHFVGWKGSEYLFLEYIESTGTQYIDTGIVPTYDYTFEVKAIKAIGYSLIGVSAGISYSLTGIATENYLSRDNIFKLPDTIDNSVVHVWAVRNNKLWCDDISVNAPVPTNSSATSDVSWTLFARHIDGGAINDAGAHKIYYAKIWDDNGVLVRNLIPAKRNSDSMLGMYDTVSDTFFTNAGTGTFIAGPAK